MGCEKLYTDMHIMESTEISCTYLCKLSIQSSEMKHEKPHRDSSVGIATRSELNSLGINPGGGEILRTRPDRPWGPPSFLYKGYRVFPRGKAGGVWPWPPTPSSAEVKERVELYLYFSSGPSWPVLGWTLPLHLTVRQSSVYVSTRPFSAVHHSQRMHYCV